MSTPRAASIRTAHATLDGVIPEGSTIYWWGWKDPNEFKTYDNPVELPPIVGCAIETARNSKNARDEVLVEDKNGNPIAWFYSASGGGTVDYWGLTDEIHTALGKALEGHAGVLPVEVTE